MNKMFMDRELRGHVRNLAVHIPGMPVWKTCEAVIRILQR
jgi:hypothetical protein